MTSVERPRTIGGLDLYTAGAYAGLALVAVGSIGPWVTSALVSAGGLNGDGKWTILLAAIAAVVLWRWGLRGAVTRVGIECGIILAIGVYDAIHIHHVVARTTFEGTQLDHVGWGVYAVVVGAVIALAALWRGRTA